MDTVFSDPNVSALYNEDSFTQEYIENYIIDLLEEKGNITDDKISRETACFLIILKKGTFNITLSKSGIIQIDLQVTLPSYCDENAIKASMEHMEKHFNHLFCVIKDHIHNHSYFSFERGIPMFIHSLDEKPRSDKKEFIEKYLINFHKLLTESIKTDMYYIDKSEDDIRNKFSKRSAFNFYRNIYTQINENESKIKRRVWTLGYFKRNFQLINHEFSLNFSNPTFNESYRLLLNTCDNFINIFNIRCDIMNSMKNNITHGFTDFSLAIGAVGVILSLSPEKLADIPRIIEQMFDLSLTGILQYYSSLIYFIILFVIIGYGIKSLLKVRNLAYRQIEIVED